LRIWPDENMPRRSTIPSVRVKQHHEQIAALIMAGGRSERMRSTFGPRHKALVSVLGVSLLERNLYSLIAHGVRRFLVAVSKTESELIGFIRGRARSLLATVDGDIACVTEDHPLGTIGAAGLLAAHNIGQLLVTNVDNLSTIDWQAMLIHHRQHQAAMTVAAHWQLLRLPYGELKLDGEAVRTYREKPIKKSLISSGSYILDADARLLVPAHISTNAPELVRLLLKRGLLVAAFKHDSSWIDINDAQGVADAERLVTSHFDEFQCWHPRPEREVAHFFVCRNGCVLLERKSEIEQEIKLDLPSVNAGDSLEEATNSLRERLTLTKEPSSCLGMYDEFDEGSGVVIRHRILLVESDAAPQLAGNYTWISLQVVNSLPSGPSALQLAMRLYLSQSSNAAVKCSL
jgi:NDP-mannose synthase